ncbi:hypothetical protein D3C76_725260 [compost metagenome]
MAATELSSDLHVYIVCQYAGDEDEGPKIHGYERLVAHTLTTLLLTGFLKNKPVRIIQLRYNQYISAHAEMLLPLVYL